MAEIAGTPYALCTPIERRLKVAGGEERVETITEVLVREPRARDMRVADRHEGQVAKSIALIAQLTGLEIRDVDELVAADFDALGEIVSDFFPGGQATGTTS